MVRSFCFSFDMNVLALLAALVPFAFGVVRAITTGNDYRYLWMAVVALLGALGALALAGRRPARPASWVAASALAFIIAALGAGVVGYIVGARNAVSMFIVAVAFGACEGAAVALRLWARTPGPRPQSFRA